MPPDENDQFVLNHAALSGELLFQKAPALSSTLTGSVPLLYEDDQRPDRPTICLGTDDSHTPPKRRRASLEARTASSSPRQTLKARPCVRFAARR